MGFQLLNRLWGDSVVFGQLRVRRFLNIGICCWAWRFLQVVNVHFHLIRFVLHAKNTCKIEKVVLGLWKDYSTCFRAFEELRVVSRFRFSCMWRFLDPR